MAGSARKASYLKPHGRWPGSLSGPTRSHYPYGSKNQRRDQSPGRDLRAWQAVGRVRWFPIAERCRVHPLIGAAFSGMPRGSHADDGFTTDLRPASRSLLAIPATGVSTTNLSGRTLTDLITETESELTELPMTPPSAPQVGAGTLALDGFPTRHVEPSPATIAERRRWTREPEGDDAGGEVVASVVGRGPHPPNPLLLQFWEKGGTEPGVGRAAFVLLPSPRIGRGAGGEGNPYRTISSPA